MKEPKNLREGLELHLQRGLPVMSYDNGYRTEALSKAGILDLLAAYSAEPAPVVAARDAYADQMNLELRQSIAANVLEAMDVDQYLIDAVRNATPTPPALVPSEAFVVPLEDPNDHQTVTDSAAVRRCPVRGYDNAQCVRPALHDERHEWAEPSPEQADEWARLDAANADEDARSRVVEVLLGHQLTYISEAKTYDCSCDELGQLDWMPTITEASQHQADALIAAGLIKGTSDNSPMLSGEELRAASEKVDEWLADPTPEQALRAHIADLLTDVDHFDGCHTRVEGDGTCTCLVGRIERAIAPESAIGIIARSVTEQMLGDAGQEIGDLWGDYPEIGESDWQAVVSLVMWRARSGKPDEATHREAYEHLKGRVEGGAA